MHACSTASRSQMSSSARVSTIGSWPTSRAATADVAAQHPAAAGDQNLQWRRISELSPTMNRYARGSEFELSSTTLRPIRLASIR